MDEGLDPNSLEYRMQIGEHHKKEMERNRPLTHSAVSGDYNRENRIKQLLDALPKTEEKIAYWDRELAMINRAKNGTLTPEDMTKCYWFYSHNI